MDYRIKDLPETERPREKLEKNSASQLTEVELLSLILRTGTSGKNVKELSAEILNTYSLGELADRSIKDLQAFGGVSKVKSGQLKALGELARRMEKEDKEEISSFEDVKAYTRDMRYKDEEEVRILVLSSGNRLLKEIQFKGGATSASFSPRNVFRKALKENGSAIIMVHNHPSGDPAPTEKDIETTKEIINLGESLGVKLLDHVIVGETAESMKANSDIRF